MNKLLGPRLKRAREAVNLSQGAFAKALGLSSEYISLLEAGKRTPSLDTLKKISTFLNKDLTFFFADRRTAFEALLENRSHDARTRKEILKFRGFCEKYLAYEETTGHRLDIAPLYTHISPERLAEEERRRLGLGDEPIRDIFGLCEVNGCRMFRFPLPEEARMAAIFVFDEERKAAFSLINANEPAGLQITIAAHQYCHYLKDRLDSPIIDNPDVVVDEYATLYPPRESFAQVFASHFLIPPSKLREIVEGNLKGRSLGLEDVLFLKRYFGVSTRAMLRSLRNGEHLPLVKFEEYFKRDGGEKEIEVFGNTTGLEELRPRAFFRKTRVRSVVSDRFRLLAKEAEAPLLNKEGKAGQSRKKGRMS